MANVTIDEETLVKRNGVIVGTVQGTMPTWAWEQLEPVKPPEARAYFDEEHARIHDGMPGTPPPVRYPVQYQTKKSTTKTRLANKPAAPYQLPPTADED